MHRIGFITYPNFQVLSLCTVSAFECANILSGKPLYELQMLSETGGPMRTSSGLILETTKFNDDQFDTLIVLGTLVDNPTFSPGLVEFVRSAPKKSRRVASICTGIRSSSRKLVCWTVVEPRLTGPMPGIFAINFRK